MESVGSRRLNSDHPANTSAAPAPAVSEAFDQAVVKGHTLQHSSQIDREAHLAVARADQLPGPAAYETQVPYRKV
jgi:hypothetical protein